MRKPKITQLLRRHGHTVTQRTVSKLMKALGIRSITKKKYKATTHSKHHLPVYTLSDLLISIPKQLIKIIPFFIELRNL
ncbi:TPA: IS3 family transposase [Staphylococcus pseudintermedius]|nr:IS3 family transposase [Staphylococcus pseudintermedius]HCT0525462.1 IS3 family transposase [Staphylococcus pseudintermedius]